MTSALSAATATWDGGGGSDNFTVPGNWVGDVAPNAGDDLVFAGTTRLTPSNNFAADTSFASITFSSGAGAFVIGGNRIALAGSITNNDDSLQTMDLDMVMAATGTMSAASGDLAIGGILSGAGGLTKTGVGTLTLSQTNTFTGAVTVSAGTISTTAGNTATGALGSASGIVIGNGGTIAVGNGDNSFVGNVPSGAKTIQINAGGTLINTGSLACRLHALVLNGGTLSATTANATWGSWLFDYGVSTPGGGTTSTITGGNAALSQTGGTSFAIGAGDTVNVSTVLANTTSAPDTGLVKSGTGTLVTTGVNTYTSATTVSGGVLSLGNNTKLSSTDVSIASGAVLEYNDAGSVTQPTLTLSGAGTVRKTGAGTLTFGSQGNVTWSLSAGGLIDVQQGTLIGGSTVQDFWTGNLSSLNVASGAIFSGVEANVRVDALTGAGTIKSGYSGAGYSVFTFGVNNGSGTFTGILANDWTTGNFAKIGTGTQILTGTCTYSGTTTISAGTLQVGDGVTDGSISASPSIADNAALVYNLVGAQAYGNAISGTGTLTKSGGGTLTLSGANTYAGLTTVSAGQVKCGNAAALGTTAAGTVVSAGATLDVNGQNLGSEAITISGTGVGGAGALVNTGSWQLNAIGSLTLAADASVGGTERFDLRNAPATLTGNNHALTKTGTNQFSLVGVAVSGLGDVTISQGMLSLETTTDLGGGNTLILQSGTTLQLYESTVNTRAIVMNAGTIHSESAAACAWGGPITMNAGTNTMDTGSGDLTLSGVIGGTGSLRKTSGLTLILSGANTYTGTTTVSAGTLFVTGSTASGSAVTVASGATLGGTGTVSGAITLSAGGVLAPGTGGTTIGTLSTGAVSCNATSVYSLDLNGTTPTYDQINSSGTVACAGTLTVASVANMANGQIFIIVNAASVTGTFSGMANGSMFTQQGRTFQIAYTATQVTLTDVARPTTRVWDGGSLTDSNWTTAANWDYDLAPIAGDDLQFAGTSRLTPNNDFTAGTSFASITFNSGAGAFVIGPNAISTGTISREVWTGVAGTAVANIATGTTSTISDTLSILEGPTDWAENYGTRIRGFITAPTTGNYTFWVASDDNGQLWLSTDTQAANKVLIASVPGWTPSRTWTTYPAQKSAAIALVAGQKYYIEVLQKEGGGGDNVAVGWAKPGEATTAPSEVIPGAYLSPYGNGYEIVLTGNITNNSSNLQTVNLGINLAATRTVDCASADVALGGILSGAGGLTKAGAGKLTLSGANTFIGGMSLNTGTLNINHATALGGTAGTVTIAGGTTINNTSGGTLTLTANNPQTWNGDFTFTGSNALNLGTGAVVLGAATRQVTVSASILTVGGAISGTGGLTKAGAGLLTLSGTAANTYSGLTSVTAGRLHLNKTASVNAIAGNLSIADALVSFGANHQIDNTSAVTMSGAASIFNGTGVNIGQLADLTETIASLTITGGCFNAGTGIWTVTGAMAYTGGAGNSIYVGNSGSRVTVGSLSLSAMTATAGGTVGTANSFTVYGNTAARQSYVVVGAGGLTLDGSVLNLRRGGAGTLGSKLVLNGDLTTSGSSASSIIEDTNGGVIGGLALELSSTAGAATRTASVAGGGANLTIAVPITDGAATPGALTKAGTGTLTLSGANTYTGATTVSGGTLFVTGSTAAGSAVTVASGATLGGSGTVAGTVAVSDGGTLAPGTGGTTIATLTTGTVTCNATSVYAVDLNGTTPTFDQVSTAGTVTCAGTLTLTSLANAALGKVYTIVAAGTVSGTFSGLADNAVLAYSGRLFRITYSATAVTLTDVAPVLTGRQTLDADGDGQIDRIRLTFDIPLNDNTGDLTVTVAGYAVTGFSTGTANDNVLDVLLTESGAGDSGATPVVQITANTLLMHSTGTGVVQIEGSGTAATDTAAPVLLSSLWTDGDANGADAGDLLALTFSEPVATSAMVFGDLGLPVTSDSLGGNAATTIADQSGSATISFALSTAPALSPGDIYSSAVLGASRPSGIFLAAATHVADLALAPNSAAIGNAASAVDVGATPSTLIRIEWNDTHDTVAKTWALGAIDLGSVTASGTYTILNAGHSSVSLAATSSDSTAWTVQPAAGVDSFAMQANADLNPDFELTLSTVATPIPTVLRSGSLFDFSLQFSAPSSSATSATQTIVVTITASQY